LRTEAEQDITARLISSRRGGNKEQLAMTDVDTPALRQGADAAGTEAALDFDALRNEDFLSYKVSVLSRIMDRSVDKRMLGGLGLPLTSLRIMGYLHANSEGRVLGIARKMYMLGSQVSKSMVELVEHGYVQRSPDARDRRGAIFRLTPRGSEVFEEVFRHARNKQREVAALIGEQNYRLLSECFDILITNYGEPEQARDSKQK
jgi:DNA-binding MarR family transcriptional regulator